MTPNLTTIKSFLGKYYSELLYSSAQDKYKDTDIDTIFEQRFLVQNNKTQMIVDPDLPGLTVNFSGNEIHISKELFDHPGMVILNSLETGTTTNPRSLYNPETFSTLAYLVCQNHTTFQIVGEIEEPIYVKYASDYETFYNSIVIFDIASNIDVEIIEEIESRSALNVVTNYVLHPRSNLNLFTFYKNHISGISMIYRNIIAQDNSDYCHTLFGKGSSNVIDENKLHAYKKSRAEFMGVVNSLGRNFHSVLYIDPIDADYSAVVDYRGITRDESNVTFFPAILGQLPGADIASIVVSNIDLNEIPEEAARAEVNSYVADITERAVLSRIVGVKKFYENKSKFLNLL